MIRTTGVAAVVTLAAGCGQATSSPTSLPSQSGRPMVTVSPVVISTPNAVPSPSPTPTRRVTRSRHRLPTLLLRIRSCESGPNGYATHGWAFDFDYTATNPNSTASGAYQFLTGTWQSTTGLTGRAKDYPPAVQDAAALRLYREQGTRPWNASRACWGT